MTALLEARGVVKHYTAKRHVVQAVNGVDLAIARGEIVGLAGESGSGKTTLAKMLVRLVEPTAGAIWFDGVDITHARAKELAPFRRRVQMVFQDPYGSLNPRQTLEAMLAEAIAFHRVDVRVGELLELVGLRPEVARKYPHELSGGQRQRAGIARALSVRPELVVADEPVSALDVSIRAQILNLLIELRERLQVGILIVSHDLRVLEHLADRVAIMQAGRIVEMLASDRLYSGAEHPYTRALIAATPRVPGS